MARSRPLICTSQTKAPDWAICWQLLIVQVMTQILSDFSSRLWMTYRQGFTPIGKSQVLPELIFLLQYRKQCSVECNTRWPHLRLWLMSGTFWQNLQPDLIEDPSSEIVIIHLSCQDHNSWLQTLAGDAHSGVVRCCLPRCEACSIFTLLSNQLVRTLAEQPKHDACSLLRLI